MAMESSSPFSVLAVGIGLLLLSQLVMTLGSSCDVGEDCLERMASTTKIVSWMETFGLICCFAGIYMAIQEVRRPAERKRVSQQEGLAKEFVCAACGYSYLDKWTKSPCCGEPMKKKGD